MKPEDAEEYTQSLGQIGGGLWRQVLWAQQQRIPEALGLSLRDWVDKRLGGYVRMAVEERRQVVAQLTAPPEEGGEGLSNRAAAEVIGVGEATIRRDLAPNDAPESVSDTESQVELSLVDEVASNDAPSELPDPEADRTDLIKDLARQTGPESVAQDPPFPSGPFSCIVIDPPWPMKKIERDSRAWQGTELDYPVMKMGDIEALPIADLAADDSHLYLWVTHRFLPDGLRLLSSWGFKYQCLMTWNKNTGIVPYSWMYDTEHVLFAHRGNLKVAKRGLRLSFDEPVNGHSIKPDVFYDRVRSASPGPRLDMFTRRERDGFTPWGNEVGA